MKQPIRVLFLDHTAELSGGEIALVEIVRHIDRTRIEPIVVLGSDGPLVERLKPYAQVHIIPMAASVAQARKDALGFRSLLQLSAIRAALHFLMRLRRFIDEQAIDVLHTNSLKASVIGGIAGRLQSRKVIWHIRDRIADDYLPHKIVRLMRLLARVLPHCVVANSAATLLTLQLRKTPSAVVYSGVDLANFSASPLSPGADSNSRPASQKVIGLVGRICPWKGQHIFIEAAARVHARWPEVRFRIIGAALFREHDYQAGLHQLVQEHGLQNVVEFTGFQNEVASAIRSLDILVHASVVGEPFGQVIVQGMACGKPVVATNGGGVPEIVVDQKTGLLVPPGDSPAMAEAICKLLADEEQARQMGILGQQRVQERFTIQQTVATLVNLYEGMVATKPQRDERGKERFA